ncbi:MAG: L-histidine N(alpha)-methyltransferase [Bdellovibrionales bacterium]|nr:L-histidine N(alpha)-methyltransferase [Bdellovibrionales bacterium]
MDGSPDLLNTTVARMTSANLNGVTVSGIQWKFEDDPSKLSQQIATDQPAIGLFLGQTIGNFDAEHRLRLIKKIFTGMPPGSHLIVGFATPPTTPRQIRDLLALYKHPASLRIIANPYLSMGLKLGEDFIVKVLWDQERSLFEAFVFLKRMVIIHIDDFTFTLNPTIPINNFISYRFSMSDDDPLSMPALLRSAGAEMLYSAINHELHYSVVVARSKQ